MKRVHAYDNKTGEDLGIKHADEVTSALRYAFRLCCLEDACTKTYHWRTNHRRDGNKTETPATFVENRSTAHVSGCRYDFEKIASRHRDVAFYQDGAFHLRINFPLGAARSDIQVPAKDMSADRIKMLNNFKSASKPGISSLRGLVDFLEKEFGSLESAQTDILQLHYQGQSYAWSNLYAASDRYDGLVHVPQETANTLTQSRLAVLHLLHEKGSNENGRRRFLCSVQDAMIEGKIRKVRPTVVCDNNALAAICHKVIDQGQSLFVAARPYTHESRLDYKEIPVALYVRDVSQIAEISEKKYWRPRPAQQLKMDFGFDR